MEIVVEKTNIEDVLILKPESYSDSRGIFTELFKFEYLKNKGVNITVKQLNYSKSPKNVLRGLHFQYDPPAGKLMRVISGTAFLVAVDLRKNSNTFGKWFGKEMSSNNFEWLCAPGSFARGVCALSDEIEIEYFCTNEYNKAGESSIIWNDPYIKIDWPIKNPILSDKDKNCQTLKDWCKNPNSDLLN